MNTLAEYYDYFIEGLALLMNFLFEDNPIITGLVLFIIGIKLYLKMLEKKSVNYDSKEVISEIRSRSSSWEWLIFAIILGAFLIIKNV